MFPNQLLLLEYLVPDTSRILESAALVPYTVLKNCTTGQGYYLGYFITFKLVKSDPTNKRWTLDNSDTKSLYPPRR